MPVPEFLQNTDFAAEDFDIEKFKTDLLAEYTKDNGVWDAKIKSVEEGAAATAKELEAAKIHNYDLIKKIPSGDNNTTPADAPDETDVKISDLFGERKAS